MTLRIGVVGAGTHGCRYVRHLVRGDVPGLTCTALCRRDRAAGEAAAAEFGVRWTGEADALLAAPDVDAVIVATPPGSHAALATAALDAGKPVLLEKPLTGTLAEARALAAHAARPGAPSLMLAQTLRWNPVLRRARARWPELGPVHLVRLAQRLAPTTLSWQRQRAETVGGSVLLTGVHIIDLAHWLTGREFTRVASRQRRVLNPVVEDLFLAHAELDDGCWVSLEVSKYTHSRAGWLEAVGEAGQLHADYQDGGLRWRRGREEEREDVRASVPTLPAMLADWREALRGDAPVPVTAADGVRTLAVVEACYRAAGCEASVPVAPPDPPPAAGEPA